MLAFTPHDPAGAIAHLALCEHLDEVAHEFCLVPGVLAARGVHGRGPALVLDMHTLVPAVVIVVERQAAVREVVLHHVGVVLLRELTVEE